MCEMKIKYFAYYIGDFRFPNLTMGEMRFIYDETDGYFKLAFDKDYQYEKEVVIEDDNFIVFEVLDAEVNQEDYDDKADIGEIKLLTTTELHKTFLNKEW